MIMVGGAGLVGRAAELAAVERLLGGAATGRGSALLIAGEAGVGKSALVAAAMVSARHAGFDVLRADGVQAESQVPFAGLHQLLRPLRDEVLSLPPPQRQALETAFGTVAGAPPEPFLCGLAALTVLSEHSAAGPVLVVVEDAQWLDGPSRAALAFAARRLESDAVAMLITDRDRPPAGTDPSGRDAHGQSRWSSIPALALRPLTFLAANQLLDRLPEQVTGTARRQVLELSGGNPLALTELAAAQFVAGEALADVVGAEVFSKGALPVRLERAFGDRFTGLDPVTRQLLVVAALNDGGSRREIVTAAAVALDSPVGTEQVDLLSRSGLIEEEGEHLRFRHPLMRSAVRQACAPQERLRACRGMTEVLRAVPRRQIWFRAALIEGYDDEVAAELEAEGNQSASSGDPGRAVVAFRRAADLSAVPRDRAHRLLLAGEAAASSGRHGSARELLDAAEATCDDAAVRARVAWLRELHPDTGSIRIGGDIRPLLSAIDDLRCAGDVERALSALTFMATVIWGSSPDADAGRLVMRTASGFDLPKEDPHLLHLTSLAAPVQHGAEVRARAAAVDPASVDDPHVHWLLGYALASAGCVSEMQPFMDRAIAGTRRRGELTLLTHALVAAAWNSYLLGRLDRAVGLTDECVSIATDTQDPIMVTAGRALASFLAAVEGVDPVEDDIAGGSALGALALQTGAVRATLVYGHGLAALSRADHRTALTYLSRLMDQEDPAYHVMFASLAYPDFAESAAGAGRHDMAAAVADGLRTMQKSWQSPVLEAGLTFGEPFTRIGDDAEIAFREALQQELPLPFLRARLALALGSRLRLGRRTGEARPHLREARDRFEQLGARLWASRARDELAAAGESSEPSKGRRHDVLTPQELRIAVLATQNLSNREIAERLFLSPRTVGAHLNSAFRKLGISSRKHLRTAIGSAAEG